MLARASYISDNICRSLEAEVTHIRQQQDRGKITRTVAANQDQGEVLQRYQRIESLFRQLQVILHHSDLTALFQSARPHSLNVPNPLGSAVGQGELQYA